VALYSRLVNSRDAQLAAIAAKGLKEVRYHQRFSRGWLERLGNGTELSAQNAAGGRQSVALHRRTVPCR
jgi:ring-1,2-phenylacetyl-CoA epoxidase subunit PaaC